MPDIYSIIIPIVAVLIGGVVSYLASYAVEKRKWTASAAIERKDNIYGPIFNEIATIIKSRSTARGRIRDIYNIKIHEWIKHKGFVDELTIPKIFSSKLDALSTFLDQYNEAHGNLLSELKKRYPESHVDRYDYGVILNLSQALLAGQLDREEFYNALGDQSPSSPHPDSYWTEQKIEDTMLELLVIKEWIKYKDLDYKLNQSLQGIHNDLSRRINRITNRFQSRKSKL